MTERGEFAVLEARPALGVSHRKPALLIPGYTGSKDNFLPVLEPLPDGSWRSVLVSPRIDARSPARAALLAAAG